MNRIFLAIACLGALAVLIFATVSGEQEQTAELSKFSPTRAAQLQSWERGSMTTQTVLNETTGATEEVRVIAFVD